MKTLSALLFVVFLAGSMCMLVGSNGQYGTDSPIIDQPASGLVQCGTVRGDCAVFQAGLTTSTPFNVMVSALVLYIFFIPATNVFSFYHPPRY